MKTSTEAKIVRVSNYLPNVIWAKMFLKAQGLTIKKIYFSKTTKAQLKLKRTERRLVDKKSSIYKIDISGSRIC